MEAQTLSPGHNGPLPKDWAEAEPELYKRYVASCLAIIGIEVPEGSELGSDVVAHWAALGAGIAPYKEWRASRFDVMQKWAHDLD